MSAKCDRHEKEVVKVSQMAQDLASGGYNFISRRPFWGLGVYHMTFCSFLLC